MPLPKVAAGTPYKPSAELQNQISLAADIVLGGRQPLPSAEAGGAWGMPANVVLITNASGSARVPGDVLKITGATASFPDLPREAARRPVLTGDEPDAVTNAVAILLEGIGTTTGDVGRAVVAGVTTCTVNVVDATHEYAVPTAGDCSKLTSVPHGPIRILAKDSGTGDKAAVVQLGAGFPRFARVYINDGSSGPANVVADAEGDGSYSGTLYVNDGDGTWSTGPAVRVSLLGGDTFLNQKVYTCELNGTITDGSVYPRYWNAGNVAIVVDVCNEADPETPMYNLWLIGEQSTVIEDVDPDALPGGL